MRVEYDPELVEQAVFLAVRQDHGLEQDFHAAVDPLYEIPDSHDRTIGFREINARFFRRLALDAWLAGLLAERSIIAGRVARCIVRQAARNKDASAELFVGDPEEGAERTLVLQLTAQHFVERDGITRHLRRELLHVADMLDDDFGYVRETIPGTLPRQDRVRERYRVLWDAYVEGRLVREGRVPDHDVPSLRECFVRAFTRRGRAPVAAAFDRVFSAATLTHHRLLTWADTPESLLSVSDHARAQHGAV